PDNVMIGAFGEVLEMDWGRAKVGVNSVEARETELATPVQPAQNSLRVTGQGSVLGTRGYMSPEQARGDIEIDPRTDIFSLGAILKFMLTGSAQGRLPAASGNVPHPLQAIC